MALGDNIRKTVYGAVEGLREMVQSVLHSTNKYIKVVDVGAIGLNVIPKQERYGALSPSDNWTTVMDINEGLIMEMIEFGGTTPDCDMKIERYDKDDQLVVIGHMEKDAGAIDDYFRISEMYAGSNKVEANHSGMFVIELFDDTDGEYKISFKDGINIFCPYGVKVSVRNPAINSQDYNVGCLVQLRQTGL